MFKLIQLDKHSQTFESDDKKYRIIRAGFTALLFRHGEIWQDKTGDKMFNELLNTLVNQLEPLGGRVPVTLSNFLKLRKFRTVTVRIDS